MSATASLVVREPGWLTTVQDEGRWGWQHLGVPVGGPMDVRSARHANALVGNTAHDALLEITLAGPTLDIDGHVTIALSGATFDAHLDGRPLPHETPVQVDGRARLVVGHRRTGTRGYLAVSGGIATPLLLGSRATAPGLPGLRALRHGDVLPIGTPRAADAAPLPRHVGSAASWPQRHRALARDGQPLRVLPGPDVRDGSDAAVQVLCSAPYEIAPQSNRMGFRLRGPRLEVSGGDGFSAGTVMGMLQVPPDGEPILLMADRQTTGGYPVVAVVITADLSRAGQLAPGDQCRFVTCTRHEAMAALLAEERAAES